MLPRKKCEEIKAVEMPPIKEYLKEIQRDGSELGADEVLKDTLKWLDQMARFAWVEERCINADGRAVCILRGSMDTP